MQQIHFEEFYLVGIETRTDNKLEATTNGEIPKMWQRLFAENVRSKIKNVVSEEMYAVYSNYESNENGKYDYFVGFKTKDLTETPAELVGKKIIAGNYKQLQTNRGAVYKVLPELWMKIWQMTPEQLGSARAFQTDFEVYGEQAQNPNDSVVEVYLGIK